MTVRFTVRDVLPALFVVLVNVIVFWWLPGLSPLALLLIVNFTSVLATAAIEPLVGDGVIQFWLGVTLKLIVESPVLVNV